MASNAVQKGCVLTLTNLTTAIILSSSAAVIGLYGMAIAEVDIAVNDTGSATVEGVWRLSKSAGAIKQGDKLWYDAVAKTVTNSPSLNSYFLGYASEAAASDAVTIDVLLEEFSHEGPRVLTLAATGNQTLTAADFMGGDLILLVPNTAAKTVALPSVAVIPTGVKLTVKKTSADAFAITLDPAASETIDGSATYAAQDALGDYAQFINNGTTWIKLNAVIA